MKYQSRHNIKFIFVCVGIIFAISLVHWEGAGIFLKSSLAEAANPVIGLPIDNLSIKKAMEVQDRHVEQLMSIPGVVGVGTGIGTNGQAKIRVFTMRAGIPNIPQRLEEIPVEMKVTGMFVAYSDPTAKFRPAPIGVSTGHPDITAGTLGARVIDGYGNVYALSNNHVYANINNASIGDNALQPGTYDGGIDPEDKIGELYDYQPIDFSIFGSNTIDAAIVLTTIGEVGNATLPEGYGTPNSIIWGDSNSDGFFDDVSVLVDNHVRVQKFGRTTGLSIGTVTAVNVTSNVCYDNCQNPLFAYLARFVNQILIEKKYADDDDSFSMGGDSGSLIVTYNENKNPVGLLFAGSSTTTLANRIDLVLKRFNVSIDGGSSPANITPTANFSFITSELTATFTDSSTDSDGTIMQWSWDFGDYSTSALQNPTHSYAADGTYTVSLTVTDNDDGIGSTSQEVTVSAGSVPAITLTAKGYKVKGRHHADLTWSGATSTNVDIYRDGAIVATKANDGAYTDNTNNVGGGSYIYQVCEADTFTCSNEVTVTF